MKGQHDHAHCPRNQQAISDRHPEGSPRIGHTPPHTVCCRAGDESRLRRRRDHRVFAGPDDLTGPWGIPFTEGIETQEYLYQKPRPIREAQSRSIDGSHTSESHDIAHSCAVLWSGRGTDRNRDTRIAVRWLGLDLGKQSCSTLPDCPVAEMQAQQRAALASGDFGSASSSCGGCRSEVNLIHICTLKSALKQPLKQPRTETCASTNSTGES